MTFRHLLTAAILATLHLRAAADDSVKFTKPPLAKKSGGKVEIEFSLSSSTDVEVAVLDAKGKVVRHLAAGVLGAKNPPPPPLQKGLVQHLTWDEKNDLGAPAKNGPFRIRVRAGMRAQFGRTIGGSPYTGSVVRMPYRAPVNGLVVDGKGNLYVKMMSSVGSHGNSGMWPWHLRRFDRDGKYVATLLPYPPSTPPEKAHGFELLDTGGGRFAPANQNSLYPVFYNFGNEIVSRLVDGQVVFVQSEHRRLSFFSLDGSNRVKTVTTWPDAAKLNCPRWLDVQVAFSPDGRYAYYSNVAGTAYDGKKPSDVDAKWPQGRIYRQDLSKEGSRPAPFFDLKLPDWDKKKYWMPSAWDKKTAAAGIDTDAKGNVYVCDLVNHQVVAISPKGEPQSSTPVPWPDRVMAARKSDALYVITRKVSRGVLPAAKLLKITGRGQKAEVVAELQLSGTVGGAFTLDESGGTPVIWLAGADKGTTKLLRVEDRGKQLVVTGDDYLNRDRNAITFTGYLDVDREADLVYVTGNNGTVWRFDGKTGKGGPLKIKAVDVAVGPRGELTTWGVSSDFQGPIARYTRELKPLPVPGGKHVFGFLYGRAGRGTSVCGLDVDAHGRVFATYGSNDCHVRAYDVNGKLVDFDRKIKISTRRGPQEIPVAVAGVVGYGGSIRLDNAGNVYLLQEGLPKDHKPPPGYEKDEAYRRSVGTIYKFTPQGGEIKSSRGRVQKVVGAVQAYPGCGPISRWRCAGACACTKPRFDVDDYGRLYVPNGITFSVSVRDNAGNEIVRFGRYGNFDSPGNAKEEADVGLGWPVSAGASERFIYVGDCLNHRVVRVDKVFAAERVVDLH